MSWPPPSLLRVNYSLDPHCISYKVFRLPWATATFFHGFTDSFHSAVDHLSTWRTSHCDCDPVLVWEDFCRPRPGPLSDDPDDRTAWISGSLLSIWLSQQSSPLLVHGSWGELPPERPGSLGVVEEGMDGPTLCLANSPSVHLTLNHPEAPLPLGPCGPNKWAYATSVRRRLWPPGNTQHVGSRSLLGAQQTSFLDPSALDAGSCKAWALEPLEGEWESAFAQCVYRTEMLEHTISPSLGLWLFRLLPSFI